MLVGVGAVPPDKEPPKESVARLRDDVVDDGLAANAYDADASMSGVLFSEWPESCWGNRDGFKNKGSVSMVKFGFDLLCCLDGGTTAGASGSSKASKLFRWPPPASGSG